MVTHTQLAPVSGTFNSAVPSNAVRVKGKGNVTLSFGAAVASVQLERSFDNGLNWFPLSKNSIPELAEFTTDINLVIEEPEDLILYRWNCVSYTSGDIFYRIGDSING